MSDMNEYEEDLFDLKYLEELSELFNEFKGMDNYYGLDLFKDDFSEFFEFIKRNVVIHEFSDDESGEDELHED
tara:strand:+ start:994 stop:1212 length:219 start_codon:yes stop_codon:yes gene_type:complete